MIEVIEERHFNSKIAIINIFFCLISFSFNYSEALFRDNKRHMSHGFREDYPKISSKTIKFAPLMWVSYDSAVTPLFCRQRLKVQRNRYFGSLFRVDVPVRVPRGAHLYIKGWLPSI